MMKQEQDPKSRGRGEADDRDVEDIETEIDEALEEVDEDEIDGKMDEAIEKAGDADPDEVLIELEGEDEDAGDEADSDAEPRQSEKA